MKCPHCDGTGVLSEVSLGAMIIAARKAANLTQHEVAAKAALSRGQLANIETDRTDVPTKTLQRIADGYSAENVAPFAPLTDDMRSNPHSFHVGDFRRAAEALAIPVTGGGEVVEEGLFVAPSQDTSDSSALPQHLVELSAKATPGEWSVSVLSEDSDVSGLAIVAESGAITGASCCCCGSTVLEAEDAALIAGAVNYVRSLESKSQYGSGTPKTSTPEAVTALNYAADMVYCNADAEWVLKPDYDPYVVLNAIAASPTPPVTREEIARVIHSAIRLEWHGAMQHVHYRSCEVAAEQILSLLGAHHDG